MGKLVPYGAFALAAAALVVALAGRKPEPVVAVAPQAPAPTSPDELRRLERRVEVLEETNGLLERKVFELGQRGALAAAPTPGQPAGPASPGAGLPAPVPGASPTVPTVLPPREELKEAVRAAQQELAEEQRQAFVRRLEAAQAQTADAQKERWKKFTTEARLDYQQEQELNRLLEAEAARRKTLMAELALGDRPYPELRAQLTETRRETDRAMEKVLKPDQLQKFQEVRREERRDDRGAWRRGGGGGPPGP